MSRRNTTVDAKIIGNRLRELREERGQPKTFVAKKLGISYNSICCYEKGRRIPSDAVKVALAKYYGVPLERIFFTE